MSHRFERCERKGLAKTEDEVPFCFFKGRCSSKMNVGHYGDWVCRQPISEKATAFVLMQLLLKNKS